MADFSKRRFGLSGGGFTLVELIIVMVILAITAMVAIPMITSGAGFQIRAVANMIAADIEYAKQMAITHGNKYSVVFNKDNDTYKIVDQNGSVIDHPVRTGFDYSVDLTTDSRTDEVDIVDVDFDSTSIVKFDYLGSPYNGSDHSLSAGNITLQAGDEEIIVKIESVTGYISIE